MDKIFIVGYHEGEYDDYRETNVAAFPTAPLAEAHKAAMEAEDARWNLVMAEASKAYALWEEQNPRPVPDIDYRNLPKIPTWPGKRAVRRLHLKQNEMLSMQRWHEFGLFTRKTVNRTTRR